MAEADRSRWNQRYISGDFSREPSRRMVALLSGRIRPGMVALDLACGAGWNSLWLARQGLEVHAWDISEAGLAILRQQAEREGLTPRLHLRLIDLDHVELPREQYDVVVDNNFLHRPLLIPMLESLKPGGLLFINNFMDAPKRAIIRPAHKLDPGELARVYSERAEILHLQEDPVEGRATMLARRPVTPRPE